jgi:hypothetical protein
MHTVAHQFAHQEALERAKRWLIAAGIDPGRIEAHTAGIPRISVAVHPGESAEVQRIIDAAESSDPDGHPGVYDLARQKHIYPQAVEQADTPPTATRSESFVIGWHPQDADAEVTQTDTERERQKEYRAGKD